MYRCLPEAVGSPSGMIYDRKSWRGLYEIHTHTCLRVVLMFCSLRNSVVDWKGAKEGTERKNFFRRRTLSQKSLESSWSALLFTDAWKMFRKERHAICVARFYFVLLFEYKGHNKHFRFTNPHLKMIVKGNGTFPTFSSPLFLGQHKLRLLRLLRFLRLLRLF